MIQILSRSVRSIPCMILLNHIFCHGESDQHRSTSPMNSYFLFYNDISVIIQAMNDCSFELYLVQFALDVELMWKILDTHNILLVP
jgi:hypothetical protein